MKDLRYQIKPILFLALAVFMFLACGQGTQHGNTPSGKDSMGHDTSETAKVIWTCSMHPEIIRDGPGTCPICGMDLVQKEVKAPKVTGIHLNDLLRSTNQFVISSIPLVALQTRTEPLELEALGRVSYDTRLVNTISARVSGRIQKLYIHYRYQHIQKGERIMDIYSPDLLTDEQTLLFLIKNDPGNRPMIEAARQRLLYLGVAEEELNDLIYTKRISPIIGIYSDYTGHIHEAGNSMPGSPGDGYAMQSSDITQELPIKEGMYIEKGQTLFQVFNMHRSWILLNLFPGQEQIVKEGGRVRIVPETAPEKSFNAVINLIEPIYRKDEKTVTARISFDNSVRNIPIGSEVKADIFTKPKPANWLSKDAVLSLGMDKVVFLRQEGAFKASKVITGVSYKDSIEILSGIEPKDSVAANAQFLIDSESFITVNQ